MICEGQYPDSPPSLLAVTSAVWTRINVQSDFGTKEHFNAPCCISGDEVELVAALLYSSFFPLSTSSEGLQIEEDSVSVFFSSVCLSYLTAASPGTTTENSVLSTAD